ncbi:MAG: hypothetical protein ABFC24_08225 [Methanoregulaceae archaeon]
MTQYFGFVAILDALGISNYKLEEASKFLINKNALLQELESHNLEITDYINKNILPSPNNIAFPKGVISTFGDTIIVHWIIDPKIVNWVAPGIFLWLQRAIVRGIYHNILLRGAVSFGDYLVDGDASILGPALADAYAWSEQADWFGVLLTPNCKFAMSNFFDNPDLSEINYGREDWCVLYPEVPLHDGIKPMIVVSWPQFFLETANKNLDGSVIFSLLLGAFSIPKGVESKYENSLKFLKWYEKNIYPKFVIDKSGLERKKSNQENLIWPPKREL